MAQSNPKTCHKMEIDQKSLEMTVCSLGIERVKLDSYTLGKRNATSMKKVPKHRRATGVFHKKRELLVAPSWFLNALEVH